MKIKIIKDHASGLKKGENSNPSEAIALDLIKMGIAEEIKEKKSTKKQ